MRDYILSEAQVRAPAGLLGALKRKLENWRVRKDLAVLLRFSDYQLRDVGLTRASLRQLLARPRDCDLLWELERQNWAADLNGLRAKASERHADATAAAYTTRATHSA